MTRFILIALLVAAVVFLLRRWLGRGQGGGEGGQPAGKLPDSVICEACGTDYSPYASGWICPKCGK